MVLRNSFGHVWQKIWDIFCGKKNRMTTLGWVVNVWLPSRSATVRTDKASEIDCWEKNSEKNVILIWLELKKKCQNWPNYLSHLAKTAVKVGQNKVKRCKMNVKITLKTIIHRHCSNVLLQTADLRRTKFVWLDVKRGLQHLSKMAHFKSKTVSIGRFFLI